MAAISLQTVTLLARIAFLIGAVTDGLAVVPMLSRRAGAAIFGGDASRGIPEYSFAMGIGGSLMMGWTLLLVWGAVSPLERRDLLLLTVFPVITGIVVATIVAARRGVVRASRVVPLWVHLGAVSLLYVTVWVLSMPFAR